MHTHIRTHIRTYIVTGLISAVSAHLSQQVVHGVVCYNLEPAIQVVLLRDIAVNTLYDICDLQHTKFTIHILNTLNSIGRFSIVWPDIVAGISFGKFVIYTQTAKLCSTVITSFVCTVTYYTTAGLGKPSHVEWASSGSCCSLVTRR